MAKKESKTQQARVLGGFTLDGIEYQSNEIIEADPALIASLGTSVDTDKDAVAHCLVQEGAQPRLHPSATVAESPAAAAAEPSATTEQA